MQVSELVQLKNSFFAWYDTKEESIISKYQKYEDSMLLKL